MTTPPERLTPPRSFVTLLLLAASGVACVPESDVTNLTGISDSSTTDGTTGDTGSNDTDTETDEGSTGEPEPNCGPQPQQCADLIECLAVVLPDIDVSTIEPNGACWCGNHRSDQRCARDRRDQQHRRQHPLSVLRLICIRIA